MRADRPQERGAALLTVLLIVAVISVLAATALEHLRLATRLASNAIALDQARSYAQAAEGLTTVRIDQLLRRDAARVTLAGGWSGTPQTLKVPEGVITATITDGGNCFNLNSLVAAIGPDRFVARPEAINQFARLMRLLGIDEGTARPIAAAAADWIDTDNDPQPQGAEDSAYAGLAQRYRTAGTLMTDRSELRAVMGVTPAIYAKLEPWLCALPKAQYARININTLLPEQAALLAMLTPDTLDIGRAHVLLQARPTQGYASVTDFWRGPASSGITADPGALAQMAVTSQWFTLKAKVEIGGTELNETALIDATQTPVRLVSRSWGDPS
jgi:general secretion pathway protein K